MTAAVRALRRTGVRVGLERNAGRKRTFRGHVAGAGVAIATEARRLDRSEMAKGGRGIKARGMRDKCNVM